MPDGAPLLPPCLFGRSGGSAQGGQTGGRFVQPLFQEPEKRSRHPLSGTGHAHAISFPHCGGEWLPRSAQNARSEPSADVQLVVLRGGAPSFIASAFSFGTGTLTIRSARPGDLL